MARRSGTRTIAFEVAVECPERAQERALARTAAAEQRDELAAADLEVQIVDHGVITERLSDSAGDDDGVGGRLSHRHTIVSR